MDKEKLTTVAILSTVMSWLGILTVPVFLLVGCNILDYITGLMAAGYRQQDINSYKSIRGITKKVCQWLLVMVGCILDAIIQYAVSVAGVELRIPFVVATVVAVWLVVNELISILENIIDIGVEIPPFLLPVVRYIKKQAESTAQIEEDDDGKNGDV